MTRSLDQLPVWVSARRNFCSIVGVLCSASRWLGTSGAWNKETGVGGDADNKLVNINGLKKELNSQSEN